MADKTNAETETASAATETGSKRPKPTKVEAVRRAIAALGAEASRKDVQGYVRQKFGLKIGLDHISNCKGELAKRAAKAATPAGRPAAAAKPAAFAGPSKKHAGPKVQFAQTTTAPHNRQAGGNGPSAASILLEDVLTAKLLIDRVGAGPLKTLIDGLTK